MNPRAAELIASLKLRPHPEGGHYGELYRSASTVHPDDGRGVRSAITTIYFLLAQGAVSRWHRVQSDEVWHFYEGDPLDLWSASPGGEQVDHYRLGLVDGSRRPVWTVPAGHWQAARSTGSYTLVGCTVGPGFEYQDFAFASDAPAIGSMLRARHPALAGLL